MWTPRVTDPLRTPRRSIQWNLNASSSSTAMTASQVIEQGNSHVVENYGSPLPVLIVEALSLVERSRDISARLDPSGWACIVCGRRLFVWRYKLSWGQRFTGAMQCRELTLPPSDLAHKADLVCVLPADGGDELRVPSVVAVSPEGTVRYWPSIAHDGNSSEISVELHGQECFSLVNSPPHGCILATTTGSLILIEFDGNADGQLMCHNLTVAQGVFARFGRRVSSFIFGGSPNLATEYRLARVLYANEQDSKEKMLYVLTGSRLQKWEIGKDSGDKLILDCDVESFVRDKFVAQVWSRDMIHPHQLKAWLIDMQLSKYGLFVLAGATSPKEPHRLRLALGVLDTRGGVGRPPPSTFSSFVVLPHSDVLQESVTADEADEDFVAFGYRLLFPDFNSEFACVYKDRVVLCIPLVGGEEMDKIELHQPGDHIVGAGSCDGFPLFFSNSHGIVAIKSSHQDDLDLTASNTSGLTCDPSVENFNLTCTFAELQSLATSTDKSSQLKAALLLFCRKDLAQCHALIQESFPLSSVSEASIDANLDVAVASLSKQTIDDFPVSDPRWAETVSNEPSMITASLIILHQLEDKQKAHKLLIKFLHAVGIWDRLRSVIVMGNVVETCQLLCEHEEKLVAALTLRSLQPKYANLLESAIKVSLRMRKVASSLKLTIQDLFYREVSCVGDIVIALFEVEEKTVAEGSPQSIVTTISSVNNIILSVLRQIALHRQGRSCDTSLLSHSGTDHVPLSASKDPSIFLSLLIKQYRMTLDHAVGAAQDTTVRGSFFQQLMDLADAVLDGYKCQLRLMEVNGYESTLVEVLLGKYEQDRQALILPLINVKQYERAAALGEKYLDFDILIRLCEATDNNERLKQYISQFKDQGFSEFMYNWYLKEGKRGKLLSQPMLQCESLHHFLDNHHHLSWLQDIQLENFAKAHRTLKTTALSERDILARKRTLLSLSKLCALASDALPKDIGDEIEGLREEEALVVYQETLPTAILESYGFDEDTMRVLSPVELIELYVSDDNVGANEYDFKKALELLLYVEKMSPEDVERLRLHIWCRSILKDSWDEFDESCLDDPLEAGSRTMFFRTVELAFSNGMDVKDMLPSSEVLLDCPVLETLAANANFRYLIQACYEQIYRVMT